MDWKKLLLDIITTHKGKAVGVLTGLVFGLITIIFGFLKAFFLSICIFIGYYIGNKIDKNGDMMSLIEKVWKNH